MITYEIPLERFGDTYNGKPLMYAALASQKNHMAIYLKLVGHAIARTAVDDFIAQYRRARE
jgi:hypothetical protein